MLKNSEISRIFNYYAYFSHKPFEEEEEKQPLEDTLVPETEEEQEKRIALQQNGCWR